MAIGTNLHCTYYRERKVNGYVWKARMGDGCGGTLTGTFLSEEDVITWAKKYATARKYKVGFEKIKK